MNLTLEMIVASSAGFLSLIGIISAMVSQRQYRHCRRMLEFAETQIGEMDSIAGELQENVAEFKQRAVDQSRRIAWLESRLRQPKKLREEREEVVIDDAAPKAPVKWNMTERRHRVLSLAARGQNPNAIAATLGMMPGEVELIINLNQASFAAFAQS